MKRYLDTVSSVLFKAIYEKEPTILKVFKDNSDETKSSLILKAYEGLGAVKVYHHTDSAIPMQAINPGYELADITKSGHDNDATMIFCDVVKKLHSKKFVSESLPSISDLGQGFRRYEASNNKKISDDLLRKAQRIFLI